MSSASAMARVWLTAFLLCLAGIVAILSLPGAQIAESRPERFAHTIRRLDPAPDILVLGSSLSMLAFPPQFRVGAAPGSSAPAGQGLRMALSCIEPETLARMMKEAVARGIPKIIIEVNHLLYVMNPCHPEPGLKAKLSNFALALRLRIKWTVLGAGAALNEVAREPDFLTQTYDGDESQLEYYYPLRLRSPKAFDLLETLVAAGREKGLEVILVVMPRSETASQFLGAAFGSELDARLAALRRRFANMVWAPAQFWPDRYFADHAHMNQAGRERFLAEFGNVIGEVR